MSLFMPSNFKSDWYGWVTNQWSHVLLGQIVYAVIMFAALASGEFASRAAVWWAIAIAYIAWELVTNNTGKWWDSIEDFIFVAVYGAGSVATAFHEIAPGQSLFMGDAMTVFPLVGLFAFHTTCGIIFRMDRKAKAHGNRN